MAMPYNVLLILLDDLNFYGFNKMGRLMSRVTPDGADGNWVRFPRAYVDYSLCGPSRYGVLSGRFARHHGCLGHFTSNDVAITGSCAAADAVVAPFWLPTALQGAGYATFASGKMPNKFPFAKGDLYVPPGFDGIDVFADDSELNVAPHKPGPVAKTAPQGGGFWNHDGPEYWYYYRCRGAAGIQHAPGLDQWLISVGDPGGTYVPQTGTAPRGMPGRSYDTNTHYSTDLFSAKLQEWLIGEGNSGAAFHEPFFGMLWVKACHNGTRDKNGIGVSPAQPLPPTRHAGRNFAAFKSDGTTSANAAGALEIPLTPPFHAPSFDENIGDKPLWYQFAVGNDPPNLTDMDTIQKGQWLALQAVDEMIFDIMALLTSQPGTRGGANRLEETVIILSNDNGFEHGTHKGNGKGTPYEHSIRTNIWMRHPDIRNPGDPVPPGKNPGPGRHTDYALVSLVDIAPTIAEVAGIHGIKGFDGMSFIRRAKDPTAPFRRDLRFEYNGDQEGGESDIIPSHEGIISQYPDETNLWKYVDLAERPPFAAESEMYDLGPLVDGNVPGGDDEKTNQINNGAHAAKRKELKGRKDALFSS